MTDLEGEAVLRIRVDDSDVEPGAKSAGKKAGDTAGGGFKSGFTSSLKGLAGIAAGVVATGAAVSFFKGAVDGAQESRRVFRVTEATIKATGGAANVTAQQVSDLAGALSEATGQDDELIQSGANLLLTFKNVRNEVGKNNDIFNQATEAALDLSAAGLGSVKSASLQLGKALNDPLKGISALSRSGVTFTAQQKEQITALVESGDVLKAQKIILGEVQAQVGGVARATAESTDRAGVAFGNLQEQIGGLLLPAVDAAAALFADVLAPAIGDGITALSNLGPVFSTIRDTVVSFVSGIGGPDGIGGVTDGFTALAATIGGTFTTVVLPALLDVFGYVQSEVLPVVSDLVGVVITELVPAFLSLAGFIYGTLYPAIIGVVTAVARNLRPVLDALFTVIRDSIIPTFKSLVSTFREDLLPALAPIIQRVVQVTGVLLKVASAVLGKVLPVVVRFAGFLIRNLVPFLAQVIVIVTKVIGVLFNLGASLVRAAARVVGFGKGLVSLVKDGLNLVFSTIAALPGRILGLAGKFLNVGKSIIRAFVDGLKNAGGVVGGIAGNVWDALRGLLNSAIDRINAALEFRISLPGPDVTINPPNIQRLARGTQSFGGGLALVGEVGPELVGLPRGSSVTTAADTRRLLDPDVLAAAFVRVLREAGITGGPDVKVYVPTGDPEAIAVSVVNALAAAAG